MNKQVKTTGFILKKRHLLGNDVLVSVFSQDYGKIILIGKGSRVITSRRIASLESGNLINFELTQKNERFYLHGVNLRSIFSQIKKNSATTKQYYLFLYVIDALSPEFQKEEDTYNLLIRITQELSGGILSTKTTTHFLLQLLRNFGYKPEHETMESIRTLIESITNKKMPRFII